MWFEAPARRASTLVNRRTGRTLCTASWDARAAMRFLFCSSRRAVCLTNRRRSRNRKQCGRRQRRHALRAEGIQPSHCSLPIINQHAFSCFPQINTITNDPVYVLVVLLHLKEEQYSFVLLEIDLPNSKILIQKKNRGKWPGRPARRR